MLTTSTNAITTSYDCAEHQAEHDLAALSLTAKNDNSNPQQGNGKSKINPNKKEERKLFVGGLPGNVTNEGFLMFFEQFGRVIDSVVMFDRETQVSRGFGFVTFEDLTVAQKVLGGPGKTKNKIVIDGTQCEVKVSVPKKALDFKNVKNNRNRIQRNLLPLSRPTNTDVDQTAMIDGNNVVEVQAMKGMKMDAASMGNPSSEPAMQQNQFYGNFYSYPQAINPIYTDMSHGGMYIYPPNYIPQPFYPQLDHDPRVYAGQFYHNATQVDFGIIKNQFVDAGGPPFMWYPMPFPQNMYNYMMPPQYSDAPYISNYNEQNIQDPTSESKEEIDGNNV